MNTTNVQREYKAQPSDSTGVPVNDNRRNRTGNVVPMRKRFGKQENADENPFHETMDETFSKQYTNPVNSNINRVERTYAPANQNQPQYRTTNVPQVRKKVNHKEKKASTEAKLIARLKLAPINAWVGSWAMFWYLSFQLPFALISTVGFGIAFSVYNYIANLPAGQVLLELGLDAIKLVGEGASTAGQVIQFVSDALFGIPFDPISLFILPFALILILSLLQLIIIWSIYSLAGIKSLTGEKAAIKNMMFLIAGIGGVIPILNIFPLIFLWILIVWKYPK